MNENFENKNNEIEGKKKQNRPHFKEEAYPFPSMNKYPPDIKEQKTEKISYLDIFK